MRRPPRLALVGMPDALEQLNDSVTGGRANQCVLAEKERSQDRCEGLHGQPSGICVI